jgi:drug/metabolite transporter (DMT)-like permease
MSEPKWGEPGYRPPAPGEPGYRPVPPRPKASRGHKWALWGAVALGVLGLILYVWAIGESTDTNNNGCTDGNEAVFAHPWVALAAFLMAVAALVVAVVVSRRGRARASGLVPRFGYVVTMATGVTVGLLALLPLGGLCG